LAAEVDDRVLQRELVLVVSVMLHNAQYAEPAIMQK